MTAFLFYYFLLWVILKRISYICKSLERKEMNERCFLYFHCFIYRQLIKAMAKTKEQLLNILSQFKLDEKAVSAEPFGNGHINDTLKVTTESGKSKYVLQRINHLIFTNVDMLQNNIQIVTTHIREKLEAKGETDIDRKVLTFLPTKEGKYYYFDGDSYW